ncbi:MAG: TetR/AcrR family transcriptional regulator [Actinomycetota bacterium]
MATDTADRLRDAVLTSIRRHGYAGTSMQDLLRETGVSSSSMYHFFPGGKEELVASAVRAHGLEAATRIAEVLESHEVAEAIELIFAAAATEMGDHDFALGCPIGVPATEAPADSEAIQRAVADVFAAWAEAYASALRASGLPADEASRLGRFIVASYEGSVTLARATRSTAPYRDATALIAVHLTR